MANNNLMVGLEIGTSKICVVVGESRPDGTLKILGVGQAPSRGVRKGEIVDFETAMKCVHEAVVDAEQDRKSTRLNSSHLVISYAVFCLKKKNHIRDTLSPSIASRSSSMPRPPIRNKHCISIPPR